MKPINKNLFSIITVSKNNFSQLKKTYTSIKKLNYPILEWIVIIKGNCKKSIKLLRGDKFLKKKIIINKDKNLWDAMNIGIKNSSGKYLIFMNAGDLFYKKNILNIINNEIIKNNEPDVIYGNTVEKIYKKKRFKKSLNHIFIFYGLFANHQSFFIKRKVLIKIKYPYDYKNFKYTADYALIAKLFKLRKTFFKTDEFISVFLYGGLSYSKEFLNKGRKEQMTVKKKILNMNIIFVYLTFFLQKFLWLIRLYLNPIYRLIRY